MNGPREALLVLLAALARRRLAVGAVAVATVALGMTVLTQMPLQLLPEIRYPHIRVIGDLPGQTSRVIEESVNEPLEAALESTQGLVRMQSRSGDGRAYLDLYFEPAQDLDRALREVTQAVERARGQMPEGLPAPRIFEVSTLQEPVLQFAFGSASLSAPEIRQRLRATVLPRLRALPGVDAVYMGREEVPEVVVDVDADRQASLGVGLDELEELLWEATEPPLSSTMRSATFEGLAVLGDEAWETARLQSRVLTLRNGDIEVPLSSIANVYRASSAESVRTRLDGRPAVLVTVQRSPRAHALALAREARTIVDELTGSSALTDIEATLLFDDSVVTRGAVQSVTVAAVGGALLAMALLMLAMRNRRHVPLVALVVAVSLSASLVALHALGQSLNLLTLAGLLLSVGLGLDYAIIYFDRLDRLRQRQADAHLQAMADVSGPLFGALLTTLAAVLPFLLVQGMVAMLFHPLIWTVVICAAFSFAFALLLLPTFTRAGPDGSVVPAGETPPAWRGWRAMHHPASAVIAVPLLVAVLVLGGRALPFEVLPVVDDGLVDVRITHPTGITQDYMDSLTRRVEGALATVDGTQSLFTTVGGYFRDGLPAFRPATANLMVRVDTRGGARPSAEWAEDARRAIDELDISELRVATTLPRIRGVQTRLTDADLVVVLTREDGDLLAMTEVESEVERLLQGIDGLIDVERVRGGVSPRWRVEPRYDALASHAIEPDTLRRVTAYALEGRVLRERMHNGEPLALRVRFDRRLAGSPHQLESTRVPSRSGTEVHLGDIADFRLVEEPTHIERREGQRVVRVAAQLDPAGPGPEAVASRVNRALSQAQLSGSVSWWLEGEIEALEETRRTFAIALGMALLMVLTLLVIQYGSLSFAAAGLLTIPLSGAGTVGMLTLMSRPLDAMVLAGVLIAVGIVANSAILVLSQARQAMQGPDALPLGDALRRAARDRLRPITLTMLSTVIGLSPLLLGGAEVFGLLQPLAIALTGALLMSIPLACLVLPGLVLLLSPRRSGWRPGPA